MGDQNPSISARCVLPDRTRLADLCRRHHIRRLALFGSVLRDDFGPQSDIDVLIEFEPGHTPGWEIVDVADDLSALFGGRRVDLVNPRYLHPRLKERVLTTAVVQYEAPHAA
jgi:predicted nucleotidyltransferase